MGYDPLLTNEKIEKEYGITVPENLYDTRDIDCVVLVTDHDVLRDIDFPELKRSFRGKPIVIDVRSFYDKKMLENLDFDYDSL